MAEKVKTEYCSALYLVDGVIGLAMIFEKIKSQQAFKMAGEERTMECFIQVTSPDRLEDPRRGDELWEYLKETFPSGYGGIDIAEISKTMAAKFMAAV